MRCLEALCEWGQLHSLADSHWKQVLLTFIAIIREAANEEENGQFCFEDER